MNLCLLIIIITYNAGWAAAKRSVSCPWFSRSGAEGRGTSSAPRSPFASLRENAEHKQRGQ